MLPVSFINQLSAPPVQIHLKTGRRRGRNDLKKISAEFINIFSDFRNKYRQDGVSNRALLPYAGMYVYQFGKI